MASPQSPQQSPSEMTLRAREALRKSPFFAIRQLDVEQVDHRLLISGRVSSFYYKQQAQEAVRAVARGMHVVNAVEVAPR